MDDQLHAQIDECVDRLRENLHQAAEQWAEVRTPEGMLELEQTLPDWLNSLHTGVVRAVLESIHQDKEFVAECQSQAWEQGLHNVAWREAKVMTLGGEEVKVKTPYAARRRKGKKGRRRKVGKRGKGGSGDYPVMRRLGIVGRATPRLLAEVTRQVADGPSEVEAQERLAGWGIVLDRKTMRRYVRDVGNIALWQRRADHSKEPGGENKPLAGKRVGIGADGGRLRTRKDKRGRRRAKTGRHGFTPKWMEPKLVTIYTFDEQGRKERAGTVAYDGTLHGADEAFELLILQLKRLGASQAELLIILGDGADWIWNRVDRLCQALGIECERVVEVLDWAHAIGKLTQPAEVGLENQTQQQQWLKRMRRALKRGKVEQVIQALSALDQQNDLKDVIRKAIAYFHKHRERMRYDYFRANGLPIGSGAVESAIRRIVNLRMKGAGIFWLPANAERLLYLRCRVKMGEWPAFVKFALSQWADCMAVSLAELAQLFGQL
jgi:hypothetical protein